MRSPALVLVGALAFLVGPVAGQPPKSAGADEVRKPPPDEFKALLNMVEEAYKAPREVDKDVIDELRKQYRDPKPDREVKIFKEIRRLYATTPELEEAILDEVRKAYENPTAEQEERILQAMRRGGQLPLGAISESHQAQHAQKLFRKFDQNGDGYLSPEEMPDTLRENLAKFDANRDGEIDFGEYAVYYQAQLKAVSDGVASGQIPLKAAQAAGVSLAESDRPKTAAATAPSPRTAEGKKPNLPDWFTKFDLDHDGQVGLYEWKKMGGATADFLEMDLNHDGFITADELLAYLAEQEKKGPPPTTRR
jgi:Ca2+-binding EF-hand superfamily protein